MNAQKEFGAYYTPDAPVQSLVRWAVRRDSDTMLDPACGDGRFLALHPQCVGVEQDPCAASIARQRAPAARVHQADFFMWAAQTRDRFDCAAGNPPFIRYQRFDRTSRWIALRDCKRLGANFSALTSSWAPFLVIAASLLRPGGRLAFVVPAEVGHAPYAEPLLSYLAEHFARVQFVAVRKKIFPNLSEDVWLLFADGFGESTNVFEFKVLEEFAFADAPPANALKIAVSEWRAWNCRLRAFLLPPPVRDLYRNVADGRDAVRLGDVAKVGIGYVTGANDFFHLRPSTAAALGIAKSLLHPAVRNGRNLNGGAVTETTVARWRQRDEPYLLLRIKQKDRISKAVQRYLDSPDGQNARRTYKCRNRKPWYVVPDVTVPQLFLSYMSGNAPALVANNAGCVCTNSIHCVTLSKRMSPAKLQAAWRHPFTALSCEIEGHPLGGGMLKLEPREAGRVLLPTNGNVPAELVAEGIATMKRWRHYG